MADVSDVTGLIKAAEKTAEITDSKGRKIRLRKPSMLAQYRFIEMLGRSADSEAYMSMTMPLRYVVGIDEDDAIACGAKKELEALIQRLEEDGVLAVMEGVAEHFPRSSAQEDKDNLKK